MLFYNSNVISMEWHMRAAYSAYLILFDYVSLEYNKLILINP
jgi:hypothetical protein